MDENLEVVILETVACQVAVQGAWLFSGENLLQHEKLRYDFVVWIRGDAQRAW